MRAVGLIAEYNPFHNGHLYHLRESRRAADADVAVAVMSGHFLQRGEPALVDKWVRAKMALRAGVDLVVELPFPFACQSAPHFALGAVQALNAFCRIDTLCFGSESGDLEKLERIAGLLMTEEEEVAACTGVLLRRGVSYPEARAKVFARIIGDAAEAEELNTPNNILGIEYLRALRKTASPLKPLTVRRIGAGYHDKEAGQGGIASATTIRRLLGEGGEIAGYIPEQVFPLLRQAVDGGRMLDSDLLQRLLLAQIFRGREYLRGIYQVDNGIENRLVEAALESFSYDRLAASVKSRQLTRTRIQRILAYILNDVKREEMEAFLASGPLYLHVLGFSDRGRVFLAACRKSLTLPLVTNYSRVYPILKRFYHAGTKRYRLAERMLDLELRATCNYTLVQKRWPGGNRNRDFYEEVISGQRLRS
jgi:predicted nucleotidyltransferase